MWQENIILSLARSTNQSYIEIMNTQHTQDAFTKAMNLQYLRPAPLDRAQVVEDLKARFEWPLEYEFNQEGYELINDIGGKRHIVSWPREILRKDPKFEDYIRDLVCALFAEKFHPQFALPAFSRKTDRDLIERFKPIFRYAADWFIDEELRRICPEVINEEIDNEFRHAWAVLRKRPPAANLDFSVLTGLVLAEAYIYRNMRLDAPDTLSKVMMCYLKAASDKPSRFTLQSLVKSLFAVVAPNFTEQLIRERDYEHWEIIQLKVTPPQPEEELK